MDGLQAHLRLQTGAVLLKERNFGQLRYIHRACCVFVCDKRERGSINCLRFKVKRDGLVSRLTQPLWQKGSERGRRTSPGTCAWPRRSLQQVLSIAQVCTAS